MKFKSCCCGFVVLLLSVAMSLFQIRSHVPVISWFVVFLHLDYLRWFSVVVIMFFCNCVWLSVDFASATEFLAYFVSPFTLVAFAAFLWPFASPSSVFVFILLFLIYIVEFLLLL